MTGESPEIGGTSDIDVPMYAEETLRSGFPGIRDLPERTRQLQLDSYVARIVERELPENGIGVHRRCSSASCSAASAPCSISRADA
jgi:uncharacterized protein